MTATTIEQSKRLIELGLDSTTADMVYSSLHGSYPWVWTGKPLLEMGDIPAWSLSALLDLMPQVITTDNGDDYILEIGREDDVTYSFGYRLRYDDTIFIEFTSQEAVEAAYKLTCWLLRSKHI